MSYFYMNNVIFVFHPGCCKELCLWLLIYTNKTFLDVIKCYEGGLHIENSCGD